jgi:hypothetical protein
VSEKGGILLSVKGHATSVAFEFETRHLNQLLFHRRDFVRGFQENTIVRSPRPETRNFSLVAK